MVRYRTKFQIVAEILKMTKDGAKKYHIMYKVNLSYKLLVTYTNELLGNAMLTLGENGIYIRTPRGEEFIKKFYEYQEILERIQEELSILKKEKENLELFFVTPTAI